VVEALRRQLLDKVPGLPSSLGDGLKNDLNSAGQWDLTTATGQWHQQSYQGAPDWLKSAVLRAGTVNVQVRIGVISHFDMRNTVVMGHPQDTPIGKAVWRHEFGHVMDSKAGTAFMRSTASDFTAAMDQDAANIKTGSGLGRTSASQNGILQANRLAAKDIANQLQNLGSAQEREAWLRTQASNIGLDFDEFRTWFSAYSAPGDLQIGNIFRDWWEGRFLLAWKRGDAQGLLDALEQVERGEVGQAISGQGTRAYNKGVPGIVSDLFSAATNKRVEGCGSHSSGYYRKRASWGRQAECWANLCSVVGSGPVGESLLERFTPAMLEVLKGAL
jgi:hypothetical protein